jgi:hypothetical protein
MRAESVELAELVDGELLVPPGGAGVGGGRKTSQAPAGSGGGRAADDQPLTNFSRCHVHELLECPCVHMPGADADANASDRNYLVLAKPNVIMNDIRVRGLAVAGSDAAGRKSPHNHVQTARNLRRLLRKCGPLVPS